MPPAPFPDRPRVDAHDKVTGIVRYAADLQFTGMLYAMTVPAGIAKGRISSVPTDAAMRVPGVVRVLTPSDFPTPASPPTLEFEVAYRGQPVALVIAQTLEAAIEGAEAIRPLYEPVPFASVLDSAGARRIPAEAVTFGSADSVLASATRTIEATYESPTQHHNPIELIATIAVFTGGQLVIHESSQDTQGVKNAVSAALGIDPTRVDVKGSTIGGSFGQKETQRQTALVAHAAMLTGRPVKLVQTRGQIFHTATYRPNSLHHIRVGADPAGRIVALLHDVVQEQSEGGYYPAEEHHKDATRLYGIGNYHGTAANLVLDRNAPGYMRGTHSQPSVFAMESAIDELSYELGMDPVQLRLANGTTVDPQNGRTLSSRSLDACLTEGTRRFGWSRRTPEPLSMRATNGALVGWGVASGIFQSAATPAIATLRIGADGSSRFTVSGHEMGQGMRNVIVAILLSGLDLDEERLEIAIADTTVAPQHMTAGSWGTASVAPAAASAVETMQSAFARLLDGRAVAGNLHRQLATLRRPFLQVEVSQLAPGQTVDALESLRQGGFAAIGPEYPGFTSHSYSAHFVEVHVEPRTRRLRIPRVVTIADCGRVVSPRTAASQVYGQVVWGVSHALLEATEIDPRYGGYLNNDLADYVVAVNADIGEIDVGLLDEPDPMANSVGVKGLGQSAMVGVSAAVANAVFHATGIRVRKLPIRVEDLL
ncbi:molybdopterin-dependent oxidoreductase [Aurantimonas endophytica]|nr:molybdopterin-dependent oxidoreductase [Aurantimonas endophytica]